MTTKRPKLWQSPVLADGLILLISPAAIFLLATAADPIGPFLAALFSAAIGYYYGYTDHSTRPWGLPMIRQFLNSWKSLASIQGALALMFGATVCYLAIAGREIPGILLAILGTIIGFYFGRKKTLEE